MERSRGIGGATQFRIKYKETAIHSEPSAISGYLGTLRKGAVMEIIGDDHPYYYSVRLDNGLEGYVYKDAGEPVGGLNGLRLSIDRPSAAARTKSTPPMSGDVPLVGEGNGNSSTAPGAGDVAPARNPGTRPSQSRPAYAPPVRPARNGASYNTASNGTSRQNGTGRAGSAVVITSGEIAVFDQPGIVGRQVGKLRRGEQATIVSKDSFFFQVSLNNGQVGYIPRYAAEEL